MNAPRPKPNQSTLLNLLTPDGWNAELTLVLVINLNCFIRVVGSLNISVQFLVSVSLSSSSFAAFTALRIRQEVEQIRANVFSIQCFQTFFILATFYVFLTFLFILWLERFFHLCV